MLQIHLVIINNFAKCHENDCMREMVINLRNQLVHNGQGSAKVIWNLYPGFLSPSKVNQSTRNQHASPLWGNAILAGHV